MRTFDLSRANRQLSGQRTLRVKLPRAVGEITITAAHRRRLIRDLLGFHVQGQRRLDRRHVAVLELGLLLHSPLGGSRRRTHRGGRRQRVTQMVKIHQLRPLLTTHPVDLSRNPRCPVPHAMHPARLAPPRPDGTIQQLLPHRLGLP
jgi:hypothetical protein